MNVDKNNKKSVVIRNVLMIASLVLSSLVGLFVSLFFATKNNNSDNSVTSGNGIEKSLDNTTTLSSGETPDYIYHLPVASGTGDGKVVPDQAGQSNARANAWLDKYLKAIKTYQLPNTLYTKYFTDVSILKNLNISATQSDLDQFAKSIGGDFTDRNQVFENYQIANGFSGSVPTSTPLKITIPKEVRDVFSVNDSDPNNLVHTKLDLAGFAYKVAEINLNALASKKSIAFTFSDASSSDVSKHDYRLVFSNENSDISTFLATANANITVEDLINAGLIFVRDMANNDEATAKDPTQQFAEQLKTINNTLKLTYDSSAKTVSVFVVPGALNERSTPITFSYDDKLSDPNASSTFKYGILDDTLSPLHTHSFTNVSDTIYNPWVYQNASTPIEPTLSLIPTDVNLVASALPVHATFGNWSNGDSVGSILVNHLRLYMLPNTTFEQDVNFASDKSGSAAFENGFNKFKVAYDGAKVTTTTPSTFVVTESAYNNSGIGLLINEPLDVYSKSFEKTIGGVNYNLSQVDILLPTNLINFNLAPNDRDEDVYELKNPLQRIFYEDPYQVGSANYDDHDRTTVRIESKVDGVQKNIELLGDIYRNWAGLETLTGGTDKSLIKPDLNIFGGPTAKLPGDAQGYAVFNGQLNQIFPTQANNFAFAYKQYGLDSDGKIVQLKVNDTDSDDTLINGLYKQDPKTFQFILDNNGNKIPVDATGANVANQLVNVTNAYVNWLVSKGNQDYVSTHALDEYHLIKPSDANGFIQTKIIDRAGEKGTKLQDVSNAFVHYWLGQTLTQEEEQTINEVKNLFSNRVPASFWVEIAGVGKPTTDVAYESSPAYLKSRQNLYYIFQYYLIAAVNAVLQFETQNFENNKVLFLIPTLTNYLTRSNVDVTVGNQRFPNSIKLNNLVVDVDAGTTSLVGSRDNNIILIKFNSYGYSLARNGAEELDSVIKFIRATGLDDRFLEPNERNEFDLFVDTNLKDNFDTWATGVFKDPANSQNIAEFLRILSKIVDKTLGAGSQYRGQDFVSISEIVNKLYNGDADYNEPDKPLQDFAKVLRAMIDQVSTNANWEKYRIPGLEIEQKVSFLQTLIVGKNLQAILQEYLAQNVNNPLVSSDLKSRITEFLNNKNYYNNDQVVNFIVHNGYDNIGVFVSQITNDPAELAQRIISNKDGVLVLENDWALDTTSQIVKSTANPNSIIKYSFIGFGAVAALLGVAIFGISFRRGMFGSSTKTTTSIRVLFFAICLLGTVLFVVGLLPGLF